jgi:hypothetical protein
MGKKTSSKAGTEANRVKLSVRQLVLHEAGYKCANPYCRYPLTLDVHHLHYVSEGGSGDADNLLPLCPTCHTEHHRGSVPIESLRAWKMLMLAINEAFDRRSVDLLLTIERLGKITRISGDGIVDYAPLVASGLVDIGEVWVQEGVSIGATQTYQATLTEKGKLFIEGWKKGDQRAAIGLNSAANNAAQSSPNSEAPGS